MPLFAVLPVRPIAALYCQFLQKVQVLQQRMSVVEAKISLLELTHEDFSTAGEQDFVSCRNLAFSGTANQADFVSFRD
jgi:hypothetical protein